METQISSAQVVERDGDWHLVGIGSPCKKERYLTNAQIIRYADCYPVHVIYDGLNNNVNTGD
jgi:hypothetical protein